MSYSGRLFRQRSEGVGDEGLGHGVAPNRDPFGSEPSQVPCLTNQFCSTTRQRAKKQVNLEVASEASMQAFGAITSRKGLADKPLEALRFSAGF